jgi:tRNA dimethylallyltransferase
MTSFKQLALIGPTASGKTNLAIKLAHKISANILSLDSLALFKEIDIASAKPTLTERDNIKHYGIDELFANETFDVTTFIKLYQKAKKESIKENKNLIIVGGTSFYLNSLIKGLSNLPSISKASKNKSNNLLINIKSAHGFLNNLDPKYMSNIKASDTYRIEKMLNLYFETNLTPTAYFNANPPKATISNELPIYEIEVDRELLRERIKKRTGQMLKAGLIDEVFYLEKTYTRKPNCMSSIGIKEVLSYLDGHYSKREMAERIIIHTAQLAKRQRTFNKSQFQDKTLLPLNKLEILLLI